METKSNNYGLILALVPTVCLLIVCTLAFLQYRRLSSLNEDIAKADADIVKANQKLQERIDLPGMSRLPAVKISAHEQPNFVDWLRITAKRSGVELARWSNVAVPPQPATQTDQPKDPNAPPPYPKGIAPLMSDAEVNGDYGHIREFLYQLQRAERVYTLNGVKWARGEKWPQTKVTFSITRYVFTEPNASRGGAN